MAARSVRCLVSNQTDFPMARVSSDHSSGEFTDPWYPPGTIQPRQVTEWRSESNGFMTGAIGSAKYSIQVSDGSGEHLEHIDIAWGNPFIGLNSASIAITNDFSGTASADLKGASFIESAGVPKNVQKVAGLDVEAWLDTLLFPPYIVSNATTGIHDTTAYYGINFEHSPQFVAGFGSSSPPPDTKSLPRTLNKNAKPTEWQGRWEGSNIYVDIWNLSKARMSAYVTDRTANPAIQFTQEFSLGKLTWVAEHLLSAAIDSPLSGGSAPISEVFRRATRTVKEGSDAYVSKNIAETFSGKASELAGKSGTILGAARLRNASQAVATLLENARASVHLMSGVSLTLYDVFSGGSKLELLYYQRTDQSGTILASALLEFVPELN